MEKKTLVIQNGSTWVRATFITQSGQMRTVVERSQGEVLAMASPAAPAVAPSPRAPADAAHK